MVAPRATKGAMVLAVACGLASAAAAQQADNPVKSVMKIFGFATDAPEPQDFVAKTRPQTDLNYVPIFQPPPEPDKPVLKDKDVNTLKGELDSVKKQADAVRAGFPPSAKAVAAEQAQAQAAKKTPAPANQ